MKLADGIYTLEISASPMGKPSIIYPTLIVDRDTVLLIDAGYPGQLSLIREAIEKCGVSFSKLNGIILTHQDIDHVGSAASLQKELSHKVEVLAHEEEKPFINGEKLPVKLAQLEERLDYLPEAMKMVYEKLKAGFKSSRVDIDKTLTDGEELPYCSGIRIIHTPGHTPGHICLYFKEYKILIAGDALQVSEGTLIQPPQSINFDSDLALKSLQKLMEYDIETVVCYHGGIYEGKVSERIKEFVSAGK